MAGSAPSTRRLVVGVMGPGAASGETLDVAFELGRAAAEKGWVVLSGGRPEGVMDAVSRGARSAGGLTIGVLPGSDADAASEAVDVAIPTGLGNARNAVNVLSSDVVVACGMGAGTASEVALAIKAGRPVVLLRAGEKAEAFFDTLGAVHVADDVGGAVTAIEALAGR